MNAELLPMLANIAMGEKDTAKPQQLKIRPGALHRALGLEPITDYKAEYLGAMELVVKLTKHVFQLNDKVTALEEQVRAKDRGLELLARNVTVEPGEWIQ